MVLIGKSIFIKRHEMMVDLIIFYMSNFDLIFGMDFLEQYRVEIDYQRKKVMFTLKVGEELSFGEGHQKSMIISYVKERKMLSKGCYRYLAYMVSKDKDKSQSLKDVSILWEFPKVFLEDLPRLALKREVEFYIELTSSTAPIFKTSYPIAPAEIQQLKKQLQKLLDNEFIKPSHSSWGALILLVKKKRIYKNMYRL